jgi:hypothetical protein
MRKLALGAVQRSWVVQLVPIPFGVAVFVTAVFSSIPGPSPNIQSLEDAVTAKTSVSDFPLRPIDAPKREPALSQPANAQDQPVILPDQPAIPASALDRPAFLSDRVAILLKQPASVPDPPPEMAEIVPLPPTRPRSVPWTWLASAEISDGPVFLSIGKGGRTSAAALTDRSVANIIKRSAAMLGLNPSVLSSHSLRAGFVTSALEHGADIFKVMYVTRHRRAEALRGFDRRAKAFGNHAGKDFLARWV